MNAAISGSFNNFVTEVDASLDVSSINDLKNKKIKVIAFGGDAKGSMNIMGETNISVIASRMAESTDIKAGLPLSYIIRNVYNNKVVKVKLATEYDVVDCQPNINWLKDVDGNVYKTVTFSMNDGSWEQTWMAENLKTTRYQNGNSIFTTADPYTDISSETTPKYHWAYNVYEDTAKVFGRLYTWYTAKDPRNICPAGWHVPNDVEWEELYDHLLNNGYTYDGTIDNKLAKAMSSAVYWNSSDVEGAPGNTDYPDYQNLSKFSAIPAGYRDQAKFHGLTKIARWWSSDAE